MLNQNHIWSKQILMGCGKDLDREMKNVTSFSKRTLTQKSEFVYVFQNICAKTRIWSCGVAVHGRFLLTLSFALIKFTIWTKSKEEIVIKYSKIATKIPKFNNQKKVFFEEVSKAPIVFDQTTNFVASFFRHLCRKGKCMYFHRKDRNVSTNLFNIFFEYLINISSFFV